MTRDPRRLAALAASAALLALVIARPAWFARLACRLAGPHRYEWSPAELGPAILMCVGCGACPGLLAVNVEPVRPGCHGCADCVCRRPTVYTAGRP